MRRVSNAVRHLRQRPIPLSGYPDRFLERASRESIQHRPGLRDFSVQPLCSLSPWLCWPEITTETQRTQRLHREKQFQLGHAYIEIHNLRNLWIKARYRSPRPKCYSQTLVQSPCLF
jgi:hypothetical protein